MTFGGNVLATGPQRAAPLVVGRRPSLPWGLAIVFSGIVIGGALGIVLRVAPDTAEATPPVEAVAPPVVAVAPSFVHASPALAAPPPALADPPPPVMVLPSAASAGTALPPAVAAAPPAHHPGATAPVPKRGSTAPAAVPVPDHKRRDRTSSDDLIKEAIKATTNTL